MQQMRVPTERRRGRFRLLYMVLSDFLSMLSCLSKVCVEEKKDESVIYQDDKISQKLYIKYMILM